MKTEGPSSGVVAPSERLIEIAVEAATYAASYGDEDVSRAAARSLAAFSARILQAAS